LPQQHLLLPRAAHYGLRNQFGNQASKTALHVRMHLLGAEALASTLSADLWIGRREN